MELDIMSIIQQYAVIPVTIACLLLGYLLKHAWEAFPNKYIPLALLPVALVGVLWVNSWAVTPANVMAGICSAALAVYIHQNGKHLIATKPPDIANDEAGGDLNE